MAKRPTSGGGPQYHVRTVIRAPLPFVFAWCTDYAPDDAVREKEEYARKVISRGPNRVIFEDLVDSAKGWNWARHDVTIFPPDRWHSDSVGSHRSVWIDYALTPLGPQRTRLDVRWRREPTALGAPVAKAVMERSATRGWNNFARALEQDYRRSIDRRRRR
ncbi:MAG TPA: hypothetical protein VMF04_00540 [Thermoplasmata archaeon]|nr:hypothetical protein [Thermoplasmata archaeon]